MTEIPRLEDGSPDFRKWAEQMSHMPFGRADILISGYQAGLSDGEKKGREEAAKVSKNPECWPAWPSSRCDVVES